ncbi:nicotinate phosphoribosyltransferase [Gottfriedia endophytica]|nr:nicotinate phosphoribosyltransferase [Gottfriedia endophytica]
MRMNTKKVISSLHTDFYQINMGNVYFNDGIHEKKSVFNVYFRKLPFGNGYAVFMGLRRVLEYLKNFHFTDEQLHYLRALGFKEDYLSYLSTMKFTGTVRSIAEGEICFANEPILTIEAPLIQAQWVETAILNIVNYQTLVATKASRIRHVAGNDVVMEFGTRRAQEESASLWGARASVLAGFDGTSNVQAGFQFELPLSGTHAHALVQAYGDELTAFRKYAETHQDCVFLVDTYDTLRSGVPNAIKVAKEFGEKIKFKGIRLDSGDLAYLSKEARKMLDEAGFTEAKIVASNDLDEETIIHLKMQGAKIDVWGIGTKNITCYDDPALGGVYKLAAIENEEGIIEDRIKISSNPIKTSTPSSKNLYRLYDKDNGHALVDVITTIDEKINENEPITLFDPTHTYLEQTFENFTVRCLLNEYVKDGVVIETYPSNEQIKKFNQDELTCFWEEIKRTQNPHNYYVDYSAQLYERKMNAIKVEREKIQKKK